MATSDQQLVKRTLTGDTQAFGELVQRYSGLVHGVVLDMVRQREEVEDLVQEVFCKAYEELPSLRQPSRFAPWLGQIARSMALRQLRQRRTWNRAETELEKIIPLSPSPRPDEELETSEQTGLLWDALDHLDPEHRRLLVLYHLEGCTFQEIARFVDKPLTTVRWRLLQSERQLGQRLCTLLGQPQLRLPADRKALARKVLAALPPALYLASDSQAVSGGSFLAWLLGPCGGMVVGIAGSTMIHLLGLGILGAVWPSNGADSTRTRDRLAFGQNLPGERIAVQLPARPSSPPGQTASPATPPEPPPSTRRPETPVAAQAELARVTQKLDEFLQDFPTAYEPQPSPALPEKPFPTPDILSLGGASAADEFGLLRLRDLAWADQKHALVVSTRADSFRFIGYVNFTTLALEGAGSAGPQLFTLARYMSEYTSIKARVRQRPPHDTFLSAELLEDPLHFLFQALHPPQRGPFTQFDSAEIARLGEYLRHGGSLYVEGSPPFLSEIYDHVRRALGDSTTVAPLPLSHPLYRAYYRFDDGFPGERRKQPTATQKFFPASSTPYPSPFGLWGVEVDGEVAVIFNDLPLIGGLYLPSTHFQELAPLARGVLAAATNIVTYVLTRPQGMTAHQVPPLWTRISTDR